MKKKKFEGVSEEFFKEFTDLSYDIWKHLVGKSTTGKKAAVKSIRKSLKK